ncbi:hypothetical protein CEXT_188651 [Caerostris extrusa]|uniref:Uncharacterized protein n=1 Tax=Caerostris extrusa TaxID=172846 RepID=A0AAV4R7N3_CAEEX|nr:hypothetical protein CEXT_188651 [Caerostris extrusa]
MRRRGRRTPDPIGQKHSNPPTKSLRGSVDGRSNSVKQKPPSFCGEMAIHFGSLFRSLKLFTLHNNGQEHSPPILNSISTGNFSAIPEIHFQF